jgi:hypothetical protein
MANSSTEHLEAALRWIGLAEAAGDLQSHCIAVGRSARAVSSFLDDSHLWTRLKKPPQIPPSTKDSPSWQDLSDLLGDKLAETMTRVGYRPPPEAFQLVTAPRELAKEAEAPDLPRATREELAGACRTWLVRLSGKLHVLSQRCDDSSSDTGPTDYEVQSLLRQAKPPLIGIIVATDISMAEEPNRINLQVQAVDASLNLAVRWLSCLETQPTQNPS